MALLRAAVGALALVCLALASGPGAADDYPNRAVKIIAPFGAGGPTDVFTRIMAQELQKSLQQPFVVENKPGAGTTLGTEYVVKSAPDGYTLLMVSGTQTVNETLYTHKAYHLMTDLVAVAPLIDTDLVLVVNPSVPAKSMAELIALAKAKPGTLNFGSSGPGSNYHMAAELLKNLTGIDIVHVPYKGSTGMRTDILSGNIQILFELGADHGAADRGGKSAPARHQRHDAFDHPAGRAGDCRYGAGLCRHAVGRLHGAGRHAAAHRRQAQQRNFENSVTAGHSGRLGQARRHALDHDAGALQGVHGRASRHLGESDQ